MQNRLLVSVCLLTVAMLSCQAKQKGLGRGHIIEPADAQHFGYALGPSIDLAVPPHHKISHVVLLDDMLLLVESPSNLVTAVSSRDGSVLWRRVVGFRNERLFEPSLLANKILINSERTLYLLDAETGQPLERQELESYVSHNPAMFDSYAIFGGIDGLVFAHDTNTGYSRWRYQVSGHVIASPVVYRSDVFVADTHGRCVMLSALKGSYAWDTRTFGRVSSPATCDAVGVFIASEDRSLYSVSRGNGSDRWIYRAGQPLRHRPIIIGNQLFMILGGKGLQVLDKIGGQELWYFNSPASPVARLDKRLLLNNKHELLWVDAETGKTTKQVPVQSLKTVLSDDDNQLWLITDRGRLLRLDPIS